MVITDTSSTEIGGSEGDSKKLLVEIGRNDKNIEMNDRYLAIKKALESKEVAVEIEFLLTIKPLFDEFMTKFQKEEPMIHLLYASSEKLLKNNEYIVKREGLYGQKRRQTQRSKSG